MQFRFDINALRAFAVLIVVLYHFKVPFFSAGFIGVDIFFVISGFLMTTIVKTGIEKNKFKLSDFYIDRVFRIVPALVFLVLVLGTWGWFNLYPTEYKQLSKESISALLFVSNILFNLESGYFDASSEQIFLLHTWSLSVEWQFYILFPLALLFVLKVFGFSQFRTFLVLGLFGSLVYSASFMWQEADRGFYLLSTRMWEMFAGGVMTYFSGGSYLSTARRQWMQYISGVIFVVSLSLLDHYLVWPGLWALLPVSATCLFLYASYQNSSLIKNKSVQFLGRVSYSLYLWHWPIYVVMILFGFSVGGSWIATVIAIILSLILSYLSYKYVETPVLALRRNLSLFSRRAFAIGIFFIFIPFWVIYKADGITGNIRGINSDERSVLLERYKKLHQEGLGEYYLFQCDFYDLKNNKAKNDIHSICTSGGLRRGEGRESVFLWGDSHAQALSFGLREKLPDDFSFYQVATSGCTPSLESSQNVGLNNNCSLSNSFAISEIERIKPSIVLIAQRNSHEHNNWKEITRKLKELGVVRVILVGPVPQYQPSLPSVYVRYGWDSGSEFMVEGLDEEILKTDALLQDSLSSPEFTIEYISLFNELCTGEGCRVLARSTSKLEHELLLVDYGHLSPNGSLDIAEIIVDRVEASYERQ